jgi:hypothetical protein
MMTMSVLTKGQFRGKKLITIIIINSSTVVIINSIVIINVIIIIFSLKLFRHRLTVMLLPLLVRF